MKNVRLAQGMASSRTRVYIVGMGHTILVQVGRDWYKAACDNTCWHGQALPALPAAFSADSRASTSDMLWLAPKPTRTNALRQST